MGQVDFSQYTDRRRHLIPPGQGARTGKPWGSASHPRCRSLRKDGQPCNATAYKATGLCHVHGGKPDTPEKRARNAGLAAAKQRMAAIRADIGEAFPPEVTQSPAWARIPGDYVGTLLKRADLLDAWRRQEEDGGAQYRAALVRYAPPGDRNG